MADPAPELWAVTEDVWLDLAGRELLTEQGPVDLTSLEFRLLRYFLDHPGAVLPRAELIGRIWEPEDVSTDRVVDQCVCQLRRKLEPDPQRPRYLLTKRGDGYRYQPPIRRAKR